MSLCVLALLVKRLAEIRAGDTWRNILAQRNTVRVVAYARPTLTVVLPAI